MSTERPGGGEHRPRRGPVVISSLTGKPMEWDPDAGTTRDPGASAGAGSPRATGSASGAAPDPPGPSGRGPAGAGRR